VGTVLVGLGLIALGAAALILPDLAAQSYGVPSEEPTWVSATGCRDAAFGVLLLVLLRQRTALAWCLTCLSLLPVCDAALVSVSGAPPIALLPHVVGAVVILSLSVLAWREV
jgi:hypothetical protein